MINLIHNEMIKLTGKRRLLVVTLIMAVLIALFTYAQYREAERVRQRLGTQDWRVSLQQRIVDAQNRLTSPRIPEEVKKQLRTRLAQQQFYLDHNVNPAEPGAPTFLRVFLENAIQLLLPLMVMVIAADLISSEHNSGTMKLLLTRPVKRWKILLSKYITLILVLSFILFIFGALAYVIAGLIFGFWGWTAPVLTGFIVEAGELNTNAARLIPQWQFILMEFGVTWFVCLVIGTLSFMLSVLIKSTPAGMGIMLSFLIAGTILSNMVSSWESAKYLFMVNLDLIDYLNGSPTPVEGMSLGFSLTVLSLWGLAALIISFFTFVRQDVY